MAFIFPVEENFPAWGDGCFVAPNATIVGDVIMGDNCSVWFNAVIRGDVNSIRLGNKVNVQDGAVIHCTFERSKALVGNNVSIGHNAIVETNCSIAAGAVVLENTIIEPGTIYAGVPAKKIKDIPLDLIQGEIKR